MNISLDVIGAIDGCHIAIKAPEAQQDSYLNRKFFLISFCKAFAHQKVFTNVFVGFPGCAHDARVSIVNNLRGKRGTHFIFF